ncbi:unnamed protein product [Rangifer tarandus platyrhynchus]|uniref:Uncharacterized protein n=2 Tax=Rangifer tarandus platyrhynchus TaxID=3082113 RepID=A0ABN9A015_RANTA|nr:unnamed protein product [Rangifer tarandus platyrhynchus]CAI9712070.1 unnamed protein product [Rangifer tarandus platyrhynchus]
MMARRPSAPHAGSAQRTGRGLCPQGVEVPRKGLDVTGKATVRGLWKEQAGSDAQGPEDQPGREPQICGLAQGSQQAAEKVANLEIPGDPNAKACSPS